jgi:hypothetical protein
MHAASTLEFHPWVSLGYALGAPWGEARVFLLGSGASFAVAQGHEAYEHFIFLALCRRLFAFYMYCLRLSSPVRDVVPRQFPQGSGTWAEARVASALFFCLQDASVLNVRGVL